eukprot:gene36884-biopygen33075
MSTMIPHAFAEDARSIRRPIPMLVDLCLYRAVTECCEGRVLPFGVRQMIKAYAWVSVDDKMLWEAVHLWCIDRAKALQLYGEINDWDVSKVTNMANLFRHTKFNDCIDRWDVRNVKLMNGMFSFAAAFNQRLDTWDVSRVTTMRQMFYGATSFNQPLSTWDVSQVTDMSSMFSGASSFNQPLSTWN